MTGGLLQLATVGKEDNALINNPDLFHFETTYMKHTNFSIDQNSKNYGKKKFDSSIQFNLDKNSDLLKSFYFKVDIPYSQIAKKYKTTNYIFKRDESDKIYLNILNSKSFIFNISNDKFLVFPEYLMNVISANDSQNSEITNTELLGNFLIDLSNDDYSKFYDHTSQVLNYSKKTDDHNPIIKYLTNRESLWFNIFFNESKKDKLNVNLMDLKNFYRWLSDKIQNKLLYDYHYYNNINNNYKFYQHNFFNSNNKLINDVYKYTIIKNNNFKLDNIYLNDDLDIDRAISYINENDITKTDLSSSIDQNILYQSVIFPGSFLYFLLKLRYDSSYTNYFSFYHKYIISTENENSIRGLGEGVYSDFTWNSYFNKYVQESFNNKTKDEISINQMKFFNEEKNKNLTNIENLWNTLSIKNSNNDFNIKNIFTIIYTIAFRWKNYTSFETINWNDYLEQSGQIGYFKNVYDNNNNYSTLTLSEIFTNYGSDLDFSLIYVHFIYVVIKEFDKLGLFEDLPNINKKNIQFLYWCRNKISNMMFIRYKRIISKSLKPSFSTISDSTELINFYYTYVPNQSVTLEEIKNYIYQIFYNNSFIAMTGSKSHSSNEMMIISKLDQVAITEPNLLTLSNIKSNFTIDIQQDDFQEILIDGKYYIELINNDYLFPNEFFEMKVYYNNFYYDIVKNFIYNGNLCFLLNINIVGPFQIEVNLQMPINKYFFNYNTLSVEKNDIEFNIDKSFYSSVYIDPNLYNFSFKIISSAFNSPIKFISSVIINNSSRYSFVLEEDSQFNLDLFGSGISNYDVNLNDITIYNNIETTTKLYNDVLSLALQDNSGNISFGDSDTFSIVYGLKRYPITLANTESPIVFVINNLGPSHELLNFTKGSYYLEKQTKILSEDNFTLDASSISINNVDVSDNNQFIVHFDPTIIQQTIDTSGVVSINNQMYQTKFNFIDNSSMILDNSELNSTTYLLSDLSSALYYKNFIVQFDSSVDIKYPSNFQWSVIKSLTNSSLDVGVIPINDNSESNFDLTRNAFKYKLITNNDPSFKIINSAESDYVINGDLKLSKTINLYTLDNSSISTDVDIKEMLDINQISFDFEKFSYFIGVTYSDNYKGSKKYVKKMLLPPKSTQISDSNFNENNLYLKINTKSTSYNTPGYELPDFKSVFDTDFITRIELIKNNNLYYIDDFIVQIVTIGEFDYVQFQISKNRINYKKYISTNNSFAVYELTGENNYIETDETFNKSIVTYPLQYPVVIEDYVKFKILGNYSPPLDKRNIDIKIKIKIYINNNLPNLLDYTSFYLNSATNRVSDLMDYFTQTPMIIFTDNASTKKGNIILHNFPIDINKVSRINYIKLDDDYLHIIDKINSNQLIRYKNNLISSSFDEDIYDSKIYTKKDILMELENIINTTLSTDNITEIINTMENTDVYINNFLDKMIKSLSNNDFGKTSKSIYENFKNNNIINLSNSTKKVNIDKFDGKDYNLYSKLTLDFYTGYDIGLLYQVLYGSGKQLFLTNYKSMNNIELLNKSMTNILLSYSENIGNQIKNTQNNITWLSLSDKKLDQSFNSFTDYQNEINSYLYNSSNNYDYQLEQNTEFDSYRNIINSDTNFSFYDNSNNILTFTQNSTIPVYGNSVKSFGEIMSDSDNKLVEDGYAIQENSIKSDIINYNSNNNIIENQFNFIGPVIIKNVLDKPTIVNDYLDLKLNNNKNYFFIDDNQCAYRMNYEQKITQKDQKFYINSSFGELKDTSNLTIDNNEIFIYDFYHNIPLSDLSGGPGMEWVLVDTQLGKIINENTDTSSIQILTKTKLKNTHRSVMIGWTPDSTDVLENQLINQINWNHGPFDLSGVKSIKDYNYEIDKLNSSGYNDSYTYFSFNAGILDIHNISDRLYVKLNMENVKQENLMFTTKELYAYDTSNINLIKKPIFCDNGTLKYYNTSNLTYINSDTYIYFDEVICQFKDFFTTNISNNKDSSGIHNIWFYDGNINESFVKTEVILDIDNKNICFKDTSEQKILDNNLLKYSYFKYQDKFHKFSDYINSNDLSNTDNLQREINILDNRVFERSNEFYSFRSIFYPGQVNLNVFLETLNAPRHNDDMVFYDINGYNYLTDLNKLEYQDINFIFSNQDPYYDNSSQEIVNPSFTRPITVYRYEGETNTTKINILKYQIYRNSDSQYNFSLPTDSSILIDPSNIADGLNDGLKDVLLNDFHFYIQFESNLTSHIEKGNIHEHYINNMISSLYFSSLNKNVDIYVISKDKIKITLRKNTKIVPKRYYKQQINVEYTKNDTQYSNDIIFNFVSDSNYNKRIKVAYNLLFSYEDLKEPLIFEGERSSTLFLKCVDNNDNLIDFKYATNNKFIRYNLNSEKLATPNLDILIEDTIRFQNKLNFMELNIADLSSNSEFLSTKIRHNETNINSQYTTNWTLLGSCTVYKDKIYIEDNIKNYFSLVESFIIYLDDEYYYLEKTNSFENNIFFKIIGLNNLQNDIDFFGRNATVFINLNPYLCFTKKYYLVSEKKNKLKAEFGTFKYGEIVQLKNCIIMILDYDIQFELYTFKPLNKFEEEIIYGNTYYSLGTLHNYTTKNKLVNLKDQLQKNLISKTSFSVGDIIVNSHGVKLYNDYMSKFLSYSKINFGFENERVSVVLYFINGLFYYFENDLKSGDKLFKKSGDASEGVSYYVYTVKSILSNIVTFEFEDLQYLELLKANYDDVKFIFYKPYHPFDRQQIELTCNKINSTRNFDGIFKNKNDMQMIENSKIDIKFKNSELSISTGNDFSGFITKNFDLYTFGKNDKGQLGVGDLTDKMVPTVVVDGIDNLKSISISCGYEHTLVLTTNKNVVSFGENENGQLGIGSFNDQMSPTQIIDSSSNNINNIQSISSGFSYSLILSENGTIYSSGDNTYGQLGNGNMGNGIKSNYFDVINTSVDSSGYKGNNAVAIANGYYHTLVLLDSGKVMACGRNNYGQLGIGNTTDVSELTYCQTDTMYDPTSEFEDNYVDSIYAGGNSSALLLNNGKVLVFGDNQYGQLGIEIGGYKSSPYDISQESILFDYNGRNCNYFSFSEKSSSMIINTGKVLNFGNNSNGQLGLGNLTDISGQMLDNSGYDYNNCILSSMGNNHSLFLLKNGNLLTTGTNLNGSSGLNTNIGNNLIPKMIWSNENSLYYLDKKILIPNKCNFINETYEIIKLDNIPSEFSKINKEIYPYQKIILDDITFYRSKEVYTDSNNYIQSIDSTNSLLTKYEKLLVKYNDKYYYPLYIEWTSGKQIWNPSSIQFSLTSHISKPIPSESDINFYELEGISTILYYDREDIVKYDSIPPNIGNYSLLSSSFTLKDSSGVNHYPLFLDRNMIVTKNINNINSNVTFDGKIKDLSGKKYYTFVEDYCNIIDNLNLDFNSDILVNGCYFKFRNIKSDLDFNETNDTSNSQRYAYFLFQEQKPKITDVRIIEENSIVSDITITIPSKPWSEQNSSKSQITYSINDHLISTNKNQVDFNFDEMNTLYSNNPIDTSDNIFCYYTENSQELVRKFNMINVSFQGTNYLRTDATFNQFFNDHSNNIQIYRENYVPLLIYFSNIGSVLSNLGFTKLYYNYRYVEKPNILTTTEHILIEETTSNGNKIIHRDIINYENGIYKIRKNIENNDSTFMINMINPVRINNKIIQFIRPIISKHTKLPSVINYSSNSIQKIEEYLEVPIKTTGAPIKQKDGWLVEIGSKHIILLSKYSIFIEKPDNSYGKVVTQNNNPIFNFIKLNDGSFKFYLKFRHLVKSNITKVYLKNTNYFRTLKPKFESFKVNNIPTDTSISNNLNQNWDSNNVKIKIPINISPGTGGNYFVIENYSPDNIFENSSIINQNLNVINYGINSSGKTEVEINNEPIEYSNTENLWNEYDRSKKIKPINYEPFPSVKNIINYTSNSKNKIEEINLQFLLNRSKPWINWTSISFDNNKYYKSLNQLYNKEIHIDSSENITYIDNSNTVFLFEEINNISGKFMTIIKNLVKNNFENLNILNKVRDTEIIIYKYLNQTINNLNFWKDPIKNINLFLEFKNNNYRIIQGCLININTETKEDSNIFRINFVDSNEGYISRINYLDNQYDLSFNSTLNSLKITRQKDNVIRSINDLVNSTNNPLSYKKINDYQPYYGTNSEFLFRDLSNIQREYDNFILRNLNSDNFNKEYDVLTLEKILIETQWEYNNKNISNDAYSNFNKDFNDKLEINYNFDKSTNYSGIEYDKFGQGKSFGLESYNKIISPDLSVDNKIFNNSKIITKGVSLNYYSDINQKIDYVLDSSDIFQYKILANSDFYSKKIYFEPNHKYKIDILDGENIFNDEIINVDNYSVNSLNFYSKRDYSDVKNVTIDILDSINITSVEKLGYYYKGITINSNLPTRNINFYDETDLIYKDQIILDNSNIIVDLISSQKIDDRNFLIIKSKVGIIEQEIIGNRNYLKLTKHYDELKEIVEQNNVYIITNMQNRNNEVTSNISLDSSLDSILIDQSEGKIYIDYENTFLTTTLLDQHVDYEIFGYKKLDIERKKENLIVYKMKLEKELTIPMYQINKPLPINYKINNQDNNIEKIKLISSNEILVYNNDDNIINITVKIINGNKFVFNDNSENDPLLIKNNIYRFDLGNLSNINHEFSISQYRDTYSNYNIEFFGTPGNVGAHAIFSPIISSSIYPFDPSIQDGYSANSLYNNLFVQDINEGIESTKLIQNNDQKITVYDNSNIISLDYSPATSISSNTLNNNKDEVVIGVKVIKINELNKFIFYNIENNNNYKYNDSISTIEDINLYKGVSYKFDLSNYSNSGHPLRFSKSKNNKESTDSVITGTPGEVGSYVIFTPKSISSYYVFCSNHGYEMGSIYNPLVVQSNLLNSKSLTHNYKIDRDDPLEILEIDNSYEKFYIEVVSNFKYLVSSSFNFNFDNNEIEIKLADQFMINKLESSNLLLESDIFIDSFLLENHNFNIRNTITISDFINNYNVLTFDINEDLTFENDTYVSYSMVINSINYNISNNQISFIGNNTTIDLNDTIQSLQSNQNQLDNLLNVIDVSNTQFTLKQSFTKRLPLIDPPLTQTMFVSLREKYLFHDENTPQNISIQLLDLSGEECGNYVYKFEYLHSHTFETVNENNPHFYYTKSVNNSQRNEIKYLGIYQNYFYFSTVELLSLTINDSYTFFTNNFTLNTNKLGSLISFITNSYVRASIIDVSNTSLINVISEKNNISDLLKLDNTKLYLNNIMNRLKIKNLSKNSYEFPLELDYSRFTTMSSSEVSSVEEIKWDNNLIYKFFKNVKFYINDQLIDIHDSDTMKICDDLYVGDNIQKKPRLIGDKYQIFIPIVFWFNLDSFNYLPLISMDQSTLTIKIEVNKFQDIITNSIDNITSELPSNFNLTLITDNIILDNEERRKFAEYNHEYIIERNIIYTDKYSLKHNGTSSTTNINLQLKGLVKDIFLIFKSQKTDKYYIEKEENEYTRDLVNKEFFELKTLYNKFIDNNRHFDNEIQSTNLNLFLLLESNLKKISNNSQIVNLIRSDDQLANFDIELSLYLYFGKLKYVDRTNNITDAVKHYTKFSKIKFYFDKVYKNEKIINKINPVKKIKYNANGRELFYSQNSNYYNYVVPYEKFKKTPDDGIYPYSFSLNPTQRQPSGHLNFNVLQDSSIDVEFDEHTQKENIKLKTIVKEYQILRIISGMASLSWI